MCHEYEAWWWQSEATPKRKVAEPKPSDMAKPVEPATTGAAAREDEKELVPAE